MTLYHSLPKEELLVCFKSVLGEPVKCGEGIHTHPFYKSTGTHLDRLSKLEVLLQEEGPLPGPKTGLLSDTRK